MFWHDQATNTLIYDTPDHPKITRALPAARHLYANYVGVPITLYHLQVLRWLGFPTIPPMMSNYDWPHDREIEAPFRAQILTANFLALHPRALTLSDMRTGKTLALLWAADYIMQQHPPGTFRFLINAPLSSLQRTWGNTIFANFMNRRSYTILHGSAEKRMQKLAEPHDFYVINHDGLGTGVSVGKRQLELRGFAAELWARTDIRGAIFDEISAYRHNSDRHKVARGFLQNKEVVWGATGTPTPTSPVDAWGIAKLINNCFGETKDSFRRRTMYQLTQFKWVPARGSAQSARALLSPSIRFSLAECTDVILPTSEVREVEMSAGQKKAYDELRRHAFLALEGGATIAPANEAVLRSKLIQIACGAIYSATGGVRTAHRLDCGPRLAALKEIIEEAGAKVIVLAPLTSVVSMLYDALDPKRGGWSREIVNGSTTAKRRNEIFQRFQEELDPHVIVADPGTVSHSIDLTAAKAIVWFGPTDKNETYIQACARIAGPKQRAQTAIIQLASTPTEREIYKRIEAQQGLQGVMLSLIKGDDVDVYRSATSFRPVAAAASGNF
jgi:SNF2 family DNA or RNA helicase